jgi:hypothetical protein
MHTTHGLLPVMHAPRRSLLVTHPLNLLIDDGVILALPPWWIEAVSLVKQVG